MPRPRPGIGECSGPPLGFKKWDSGLLERCVIRIARGSGAGTASARRWPLKLRAIMIPMRHWCAAMKHGCF